MMYLDKIFHMHEVCIVSNSTNDVKMQYLTMKIMAGGDTKVQVIKKVDYS